MKHKNVLFISKAAVIAAFYIVLSFLFAALASGPVQIRFADSLCILAAFSPAAVYGVTLGCLLYNFLSGGIVIDVILGTVASFIGTLGTFLLARLLKNEGSTRKRAKKASRKTDSGRGTLYFKALLLPLPYIISNTVIVPFILTFYSAENIYVYGLVSVLIGETVSAGLLGGLLYLSISPFSARFFGKD